MRSLLPSAPSERLIEDEGGDGLKSLRELQVRYAKAGNPDAALRVALLIGDLPALLGEPLTIGEFADRDPEQGAAIDHSVATGEPLFAVPELASDFAPEDRPDAEI